MDLENLAIPSEKESGLQPCEIFVDEEGNWYHNGSKIIREDIIRLFLENITLEEGRGFVINYRGNRCLLDASDTPFIIARVDRHQETKHGEERIMLKLRYIEEPELLDPATLWVGQDNVLYCRIRNGRLPARFSRPAYYQLAEWIEEDPASGEFYIRVHNERYPIRTV